MKIQKSLAAMSLAIGIILGAFGAHGLKPILPESSFSAYQTGVLYWLLQSVAALSVTLKPWPARLLLAGQLAFSGSLFVLSTQSLHRLAVAWLGPVTPLGGLLLIVGWLWVARDLFIAESEKSKLPN